MMFRSSTVPYCAAGGASRLGSLSAASDGLSGVELLAMTAAGALAAAAVALVPLEMRVPGQAILKAALQ